MLLNRACLALVVLASLTSHGADVLGDLRQKLSATRWEVRRDAFERVMAIPGAPTRSDISKVLIDLGDRENKASNGAGKDLFEDDDYVAYDEQLMKAIQEIAVASDNPQAWRSLVYGRYNGDSVYGKWLASHPQSMVLLEGQLDSHLSPRRMTSVYVIAELLSNDRKNKWFPIAMHRKLIEKIQSLVDHDISPVQYSGIQGLGLIGGASNATFLERFAATTKDKTLEKLATDTALEIRSRAH